MMSSSSLNVRGKMAFFFSRSFVVSRPAPIRSPSPSSSAVALSAVHGRVGGNPTHAGARATGRGRGSRRRHSADILPNSRQKRKMGSSPSEKSKVPSSIINDW